MAIRILALFFLISAGPGWAETLGYHEIVTDAEGYILPWFSTDPGTAYDHVVHLVWDFWKNMETCPNGVKYYLQHQVWKPEHDPRGLGGDQISMALSSWNLLYEYIGDRSVVDNMIYLADYWLDHGLSGPNSAWPNLPYPYNLDIHSGKFDGDMRAGAGYLQPDKAGSFGSELIVLYKITGNERYRDSAVRMADTLARKIIPGDDQHSPWPFRVHAETGQSPTTVSGLYTSNWTGTLRLFDDLVALNLGNVADYARARGILSDWLKKYPMKLNKWGPFFEDINEWSDTEINADTLATYILEHPQWDPDGIKDARAILDWSAATFSDPGWAKYGVTPIQEQTAYRMPGNSHTSRHASVELLYCEKTGDQSRKAEAIRQLNWATYMVDSDGKNRYPKDDIWLTDGYGDYVRHYLRAMAAAPELAPLGQNHLLRTTSVIRQITYAQDGIAYRTFDKQSQELLRIAFEPKSVQADGKELKQVSGPGDLDHGPGYAIETIGSTSAILRIRHIDADHVVISGRSSD